MKQDPTTASKIALTALCALFFLSGIPALIYQLVWQRALFRWVGLNVESVSLVVTVFVLGLGIGALAGGYLTRFKKLNLLLAFALAELCIGLAGIVSMQAIDYVGELTLHASRPMVAFAVFVLLLGPTFLMGATLPILSSYLVSRIGNVGRSIGQLYFFNTMGSAFACFLTGLFLMRILGQVGTIQVAAALNILTAVGVLVLWLYSRSATGAADQSVSTHLTGANRNLRFRYVAMSMITGYIALSYQIIWVRVHMFATAGSAWAFAFVLGSFLAGIAVGSMVVSELCRHGRRLGDVTLALLVFAGCTAGFFVAPVSAWLITRYEYPVLMVPIALASALMGAVFPLIAHLAIDPLHKAGQRIGILYLMNIAGSAAGALITGYILLDIFSLQQLVLLLTLLGIVSAWLFAGVMQRGPAVALVLTAMALFAVSSPVYESLYERLQYKRSYERHGAFTNVVENRSGVITVEDNVTVYGGGIYDGKFNVDLVKNSNRIDRAYALSFFVERPSKILMIGLGSGSWGQVLANHPQVKEITIVEINPGYLELVKDSSEVRSLLNNAKVSFVTDDGRRWLSRHPAAKFDAVVINTTYHWRAHSSNLLSREFLNQISGHLNQGGVLLYNTTSSPRVMATACAAFPVGYRILNFMAVGKDQLSLDAARWRRMLLEYRIDGDPVLDLELPGHRERLEALLWLARRVDTSTSAFYAIESCDAIQRRLGEQRIISDDNMGDEWELKRRWE